jgi:D-alanyl-D-alanine carboxypeptidase
MVTLVSRENRNRVKFFWQERLSLNTQNRKKLHKRKQRKKRMIAAGITVLLLVLILAAVVFLFKAFIKPAKPVQKNSTALSKVSAKSSEASKSSTSSAVKSSSSETESSASKSDWELVLVNLKNPKPEMNPNLALIGSIYVDARIEQQVQQFLAAALSIDPNVHLISGYRSVAYQTQLFNGYVQQTMDENPDWTEAQARAEVMKTSQPPESSEHETGLAIDMSAIDVLNAEDPATAKAIADLAPNYGFILRFPSWGTASTGIDYEDWHFRYVGVPNAKYMTAHQLTLENFVAGLSK